MGVVAPNLKLEEKSTGKCLFEDAEEENDLTFKLDDGSTFAANRARLSSGGDVFEVGIRDVTNSGLREIRISELGEYGQKWAVFVFPKRKTVGFEEKNRIFE